MDYLEDTRAIKERHEEARLQTARFKRVRHYVAMGLCPNYYEMASIAAQLGDPTPKQCDCGRCDGAGRLAAGMTPEQFESPLPDMSKPPLQENFNYCTHCAGYGQTYKKPK